MLLGNLFAWLILIPFFVAFAIGFLAFGLKKSSTSSESELTEEKKAAIKT